MTVVDASVATKWFLNEKYSEQAIALTEVDQKLIAPTLAQYEVSGAIIRAMRRQDIDAEHAAVQIRRWLSATARNVVRLDDDNRDILRGSEIAAELGHPLQDCIYLAMAERLSCSLITADDEFCKRAQPTFDHVVFIADVHRLAA